MKLLFTLIFASLSWGEPPSFPKEQMTKPNYSTVVALVDTGIDYLHEDLRNNIWVNSGEVGAWKPTKERPWCFGKHCNGIDDDKNGFVDDIIGWDFVKNSPLPYDTHGHGTHLAGLIKSTAPKTSIMALKYYDNSGTGYNNLSNTVKAFNYAIKMGARIINYSGGGSDPAMSELKAVTEASSKNILLVAAAGNERRDLAKFPYYPASYDLDNILRVASVNRESSALAPHSNFGLTVQLAAPGLNVLSTLPQNKKGTMSGTSQAAAAVTGAAAYLASRYQDLKPLDCAALKRWLISGAAPIPHSPIGGGVLSLEKSIKLIEASNPK